jgi:hypothetical protein
VDPTHPKLDLYNLEGLKTLRSGILLTPDRSAFAYSEVTFMPHVRQTSSVVYMVEVPALPVVMPSGNAPLAMPGSPLPLKPLAPLSFYQDRFNPQATLQARKAIASSGIQRTRTYGFKVLLPLDWTPTGKRLLIQLRTGGYHTGLKASSVAVYDRNTNSTRLLHELKRVVQYRYDATTAQVGSSANLWLDGNEWFFDIQPLGWLPGSDSVMLIKAMAWDQALPNPDSGEVNAKPLFKKRILGCFLYDMDQSVTTWLTQNANEDCHPTVARNGWVLADNL